MQKLKTAKEISDLLSLNQQRIYELTRRGLIPHIKIGDRQYRYSEAAVQLWIEQGGNRDMVDPLETTVKENVNTSRPQTHVE